MAPQIIKLICLPLLIFITLASTAQNALKFDGVDDYVQALQAGPIGNSSRTVEAWIKITSTSPAQEVILDWGDMAVSHRFTFNIISGTPRIEVGGDGISTASPISAGAWHHIAASYDNLSNLFSSYVDGVLSNSGTLSVTVNTSSVNSIIIGRRNDAINNFNGTIDEVRVWNIVRTQTQIAASMNKEFCSTVTGLVAYYKFNQGVAGGNNSGLTTLNDLSGNSNNGTLNGFLLSGTSSNWVIGNSLTGNTTSTLNPSTCGSSYTSPGGDVYTMSGTYKDTIPNAGGCDSIITINLSINSIDTGVSVNSTAITAQQLGASYQWVNCNTNYSFIAGATQRVFQPTFNGSYAVIITIGNCVDTTACINFTTAGIGENIIYQGLDIYPNPALNQCIISGPAFSNSTLVLFDIIGKEIFNQPFNIVTSLDILRLESGVYLVEIKDKKGSRAISKLVKK